MPFLVKLEKRDGAMFRGAWCGPRISRRDLNEKNNPNGKPFALMKKPDHDHCADTGSIGFRWGEEGKWNIVPTDSKTGKIHSPAQNAFGAHDEIRERWLPLFRRSDTRTWLF
jgi:nitrate reductase alpha subunit